MRSLFICLTIFVVMLTGRVLAIAVDDYTVAETNPVVAGYTLDLDYIYTYKSASAVAVDHYWILTAAHVADDPNTKTNLTINDELYTQQEIVFHDSADLALVRYDKPFPGYYSLHDGEIYHEEYEDVRIQGKWVTITNEVYEVLIMAGYGFDGTVASSSFTQGTSTGIKRWGTNRGVLTDYVAAVDVGHSSGMRTTTCFYVGFDLDDTPYEAGANIYDSGGPYFIEKDAEWKVTGINLLRNGTNPYTGNFAAQISEYVGWVTNNIPDYDSDMDGLPDWWEAEYGEMTADGDADGDGFSNYEEWVADTVPTLGTSFPHIIDYSDASEVVFSSSSNRMYQIEYRTDLIDTNESWAIEESWFAGTNSPQMVRSVSTEDTNRFYRIHVKLR